MVMCALVSMCADRYDRFYFKKSLQRIKIGHGHQEYEGSLSCSDRRADFASESQVSQSVANMYGMGSRVRYLVSCHKQWQLPFQLSFSRSSG